MIKLYLAGADTYFKFLDSLDNTRFLVSYYYLKTKNDWSLVEYANANNISVMLDCGAWSAKNKNETLDNKQYIEFCLEHKAKFETIVSLDVIGNAQETKKNYLESIEAGLTLIPTFHIGSDFAELEFLTKRTNYIGLGGIAGKGNKKETLQWLTCIFKKYPDIKFHGFGTTTPKLLAKFNWYSVDGTTWMTAALRYGRIMVNLGNGKFKWIAISKQDELKKCWHLIENDMKEGWTLENGRTEKYEAISARYNAKSLIDLVKYCSVNKEVVNYEKNGLW